MFPHPVRSPDEAAALKDAEFLLVGGRVEAVEDQGLILSGALGSLRVRLRPGASAGTRELQPGWLIVVQGALEAGVLVQASALHVQPGNTHEMTTALRRALTDKKLRDGLADAAWEIGRTLPTWHETARRIAAVVLGLKP